VWSQCLGVVELESRAVNHTYSVDKSHDTKVTDSTGNPLAWSNTMDSSRSGEVYTTYSHNDIYSKELYKKMATVWRHITTNDS